jgi:(2R)-3-sulfolactate dehydrogenase (NADP+)
MAWGGTKPIFGTNPVAAIFPRRTGAPLVIDMSLTQVTRGQIMLYANAGKPIPEGWGRDKDGNPTTDAHKILIGGSLHAVGGLKGTMLAFAVEILCCALMGAALSHEVEPMLVNNGKPMNLGQAFLVIDPGALAGNERYLERIETLIAAMLEDEEVRLPGARRVDEAARAATDGIEVTDDLAKQLHELARQ